MIGQLVQKIVDNNLKEGEPIILTINKLKDSVTSASKLYN